MQVEVLLPFKLADTLEATKFHAGRRFVASFSTVAGTNGFIDERVIGHRGEDQYAGLGKPLENLSARIKTGAIWQTQI